MRRTFPGEIELKHRKLQPKKAENFHRRQHHGLGWKGGVDSIPAEWKGSIRMLGSGLEEGTDLCHDLNAGGSETSFQRFGRKAGGRDNREDSV
jgi:hypothetical protein